MSLHLKSNKILCVSLQGNTKVCTFQIYLAGKIILAFKILQTLHFELLVWNKNIQIFQIYYWPFTSVFIISEETSCLEIPLLLS